MTDDSKPASPPEIITKRIWRWDASTYRENGWQVEVGLVFGTAKIEVPELFIAFPNGDEFLKEFDEDTNIADQRKAK